MASVTYKNQEAIHATRGTVPVSGTEHVYKVTSLLWPEAVEGYISNHFIGKVLHICCGKSRLGDVRVDLHEPGADVKADAARLPFEDKSFDTVLCDPPYSGKFQWNHDMLNELHRLARTRIIFQHWFCPVDKYGRFKKANVFKLVEAALTPTMPANAPLKPCFESDGELFVVDETPSDDFYLTDLSFWNPRTYFGRVQVISILDRK